MMEIEINGKKLQVEPGTMIIEAADKANIRIPRFCYHKKLSIAANCRMCLVEVAKAPKPLPACATPVSEGMVINTHSAEAIAAQKAVMEFLLINHPLDCPICDQGGQCELQDVAMGYGKDRSRFTEGKRAVQDKNLGSLIATDMTRCIHCTRCVRFGQEIAGLPEMGATGRGEYTEIGTYVEHSLQSELSGNIIDLCPVGALTSKPFRFKARAWELQQSPSIAPHDCVGSNIFVHRLHDQVMRVVPKENELINEVWLSDRDRFSYEGLTNSERVKQPKIKQNGQWQEVDWQTAFTWIVTKTKAIIKQHSASQLGCVVSPSATLEEQYCLQKLIRGLGTHNIDHRIHQLDFTEQQREAPYPRLNMDLAEIEQQQVILLVGSNIQREQPILGARIRKASLRGATVLSINAVDYPVNFTQARTAIVKPSQMVQTLAKIVKALLGDTLPQSALGDWLQAVTVDEEAKTLAALLTTHEKKLILLGALGLNHPQASLIKALVELMADLVKAHHGFLTEGANAAGAWIAGAIPHRTAAAISVTKPGLDCRQLWLSQLKAYFVYGVEPELDCVGAGQALEALQAAEFVVAFNTFESTTMQAYADVILPIAPFTETSGTFVNVSGTWQSFSRVVQPWQQSKPGWKVLRVLAEHFGLEGFDYASSEEIRDIVKAQADGMLTKASSPYHWPKQLPAESDVLERIVEWPIYRMDGLVRRSQPLQQSTANDLLAVYLNSNTAKKHQLFGAEQVVVMQQQRLPLVIDERLMDDCVYIAASFEQVAGFSAVNPLTLERSESTQC
jgi:NADH-quinone oxidoreductase subunit G